MGMNALSEFSQIYSFHPYRQDGSTVSFRSSSTIQRTSAYKYKSLLSTGCASTLSILLHLHIGIMPQAACLHGTMQFVPCRLLVMVSKTFPMLLLLQVRP